MPKRRELPNVRGVYEREPGSGIWWIQYKQGSTRKREKVGRRSDAIELYEQRKSEMRAGAKLAANLRNQGSVSANSPKTHRSGRKSFIRRASAR